MEKRDPRVGKLGKLFSPEQSPLKRIGIVVFETEIQPTRSGLSGQDLIYVTEQGKQVLTEKLLTLWDEGVPLMAPKLDYVPSQLVKSSKALHQYGTEVTDHVKAVRTSVAPDDILWMPSGKKTPLSTILNPRGMRDLSFMLVPASELMGGPKWSEQNKIFLNDISKELSLDAVLVLNSEISWTAPRKDKFTNENIPEELVIKIKASTLVPFGSYHERLKKTGESQRPDINVAYRHHEGELTLPIKIAVPEGERNFETIEAELLSPMFKAYRDLSLMVIHQLAREIEKTH